MRLITFSHNNSSRVGVLLPETNEVADVTKSDVTIPATMRAFLEGGEATLAAARKAVASGANRIPLASVKILAPIQDSDKIICCGLNYSDHAAESGMAVPPEPVLFSKFSNTICGPGDVIRIPGIVKEPDYEVELVIVIGTGGRHIPKENALSHVVGYTIGHDVSARDWQLKKAGGQWMVGKTFDTFAPIGPAIVTADEVGDPHNLKIKLTLNGQVMQDSNTSKFIFGVDALVSYISSVVTLRPGDIIFTGTPPGIGAAKKPPVYLKQGDVCLLEIQNLGQLENTVEYPAPDTYRKSHL